MKKALTVLLSTMLIASIALADGKKKLVMAYSEWAGEKTHSLIAKNLLEQLGYDIEEAVLSGPTVWQAVANGDADFHLQAWLPNTNKPQLQSIGDKVEYIGTIYEGAVMGVYVPRYLSDVNSIGDLAKISKDIDNTIVGIESGSTVVAITIDAIDAYDLKRFKVIDSSEVVMINEIKLKSDNKEPIAVTLWEPHWAAVKYDMKLLKDPKGIFSEPEYVAIYSRLNFKEEYPEVQKFLENFKLSVAEYADMLKYANEFGDDAAEEWLKDNPEIAKRLLDFK